MDKLLICFLLTVSFTQVFSGNFSLSSNLANSLALASVINFQCDVVVTNLLVAGVFLLIVSGALDIESPMCLLPML